MKAIAWFKIPAVLVLVLVALSLTLCGCSSSQDDSQDNQEASVQEESLLVIGTQNDNSLSMVFRNDTGKDIIGVSAKQSGNAEVQFGANMIADGSTWTSGTGAQIFVDSFDAEGTASDDTQVQLRGAYDIQVTYSDQTASTLHGVTFGEASEVSVKIDAESGLGYITYVQDNSEASTLEAEKSVKQQEDEAAAAAAAQAKAAEEEAKAAEVQKSSSQSSSSSYDYSSSTGSSSKGSSSSGSSSKGSSSSNSSSSASDDGSDDDASQSENVCMGEGVLLR